MNTATNMESRLDVRIYFAFSRPLVTSPLGFGPRRNKAFYLNDVFRHDSEKCKAHTSHKSELEEEEARLDGLPIQMVVEPAIVAYGNERGESYGHRKVWAKAVVCVSSEDTQKQGSGHLDR